MLVQRTILDLAPLTSLIVGGALAVLPDDLGEDDEYFSLSGHLEFLSRASLERVLEQSRSCVDTQVQVS